MLCFEPQVAKCQIRLGMYSQHLDFNVPVTDSSNPVKENLICNVNPIAKPGPKVKPKSKAPQGLPQKQQ